jgi:hypothetical protein
MEIHDNRKSHETEAMLQAISVCTIPKSAHSFVPSTDIIFTPGGKIPLRNIFVNQTYSKEEQEKLTRLKKEISKNKLILPEFWDDSELLRIIHGAGYKTRKAFKDLKLAIEGYAKHFPPDYKILYSRVFKILVKFT